MSYRLPTTKLTLPNSFESIKFPVNRISDNLTFNSKIKLIDENFDKVLEYCNVVDNNLPNMYSGIYSFDDGGAYDVGTIGNPSNHNYNHIEVVDTYVGKQLIICAKSNQIDFYITNVDELDNLGDVTSYAKIKDRGSLSFVNIDYIKYYDGGLYVHDKSSGVVYVYNLISFLTDDVAISDIKFLRQFYKVDISAFDFDTDIYGIKNDTIVKYNLDFNVKSTHTLVDESPIDITVSDYIYVLYSDKIVKYDKSVNKLSEINLVKLNDDSPLSICESKYDDDILYIISDNYIYKYNVSGDFIGYFNVDSQNFKDFSILEKADYEYVFGLDENKLHIFKDKIISYKLYDEVNLLDRSDITDLQIDNLELEQDFVYNAILQKTIFNVFLLYNSLIYKPFIQTDSNGVLTYNYLENLVNTEVLQKNDIFYGQNEVFSYQTFNRAFKEIYSIQEKILELIEFGVVENTTNTLII
jgi:hypothetical protein